MRTTRTTLRLVLTKDALQKDAFDLLHQADMSLDFEVRRRGPSRSRSVCRQ